MYKRFFEEYVPFFTLPGIRVPRQSPVAEAEVTGYIILSASQYLQNKKFPPQLVSALLIQLRKEFAALEVNHCQLLDSEKITAVPNEDDDVAIWYNPHLLRETAVKKVDEICKKYAKEYCPDDLELKLTEKQIIYDISHAIIRNRRRTLEDRFIAIPYIEKVFGLSLPHPTSYFGVFDGHNGSEAANYAAAHLHHNLMTLDYFPDQMEKALHEAFVTTDDEFVTKCAKTNEQSGTTVLVAVIVQNVLYLAWAGDSQAILAFKGNKPPRVLVESHKPENEDETKRITDAGGFIINDRVNGVLAVSRAIGDCEMKDFVIPNPDVIRVELTGDEDFLVLATDGLWDTIPPNRCVEIVKEFVLNNRRVDNLSQKLAEEAERFGSYDNTTVLVIFLQPVVQLRMRYRDEVKNQDAIDASTNKAPAVSKRWSSAELARALNLEHYSNVMAIASSDRKSIPSPSRSTHKFLVTAVPEPASSAPGRLSVPVSENPDLQISLSESSSEENLGKSSTIPVPENPKTVKSEPLLLSVSEPEPVNDTKLAPLEELGNTDEDECFRRTTDE